MLKLCADDGLCICLSLILRVFASENGILLGKL